MKLKVSRFKSHISPRVSFQMIPFFIFPRMKNFSGVESFSRNIDATLTCGLPAYFGNLASYALAEASVKLNLELLY